MTISSVRVNIVILAAEVVSRAVESTMIGRLENSALSMTWAIITADQGSIGVMTWFPTVAISCVDGTFTPALVLLKSFFWNLERGRLIFDLGKKCVISWMILVGIMLFTISDGKLRKAKLLTSLSVHTT